MPQVGSTSTSSAKANSAGVRVFDALDVVVDGGTRVTRDPVGRVAGEAFEQVVGKGSKATTVTVRRDVLGDVLGSATAVATDGLIDADLVVFADFGEELTTPGWDTVAGFTGAVQTAGLVEFATRAYDPGTRVWAQADSYPGTLTRASSMNRYAYVEGAPESFTDALGFFRDAAAIASQRLSAVEVGRLATATAPVRATVAAAAERGTARLTAALAPDGAGASVGNALRVSAGAIDDTALKAAQGVATTARAATERVEAAMAQARIRPEAGSVTLLSGAGSGTPVTALKPLVIGENMDRVKAYAAQVEAHAYASWKNDPFDFDLGMRRNERMIRDAIRAEREIIDIGPDFTRRALDGRPPSAFYGMERRLTQGYSGYTKVFERQGRLGGGVRGFDF